MGKLIKFLLGLVLLLVLLVVAAVFIVPKVVDPNDYKAEIVAEVKKATGRDMRIDGDIGLTMFPWLGVDLGAVTLSQPAGFGDEPFAAVTQAQVRVKVMPLLERKVEVDTLVLDGVRVHLIRDEQGIGNWEDLAQGKDTKPEPASAESTPAGDGPGLAGLAVGGIQITNARVVWDDRQAGQHTVIEDFSLVTGAVTLGQPVDLDLSFMVDNKAPVLQGKISLKGTVTPRDDNQRIEVSPFELKLTQLRTGDGLNADLTLIAAVSADLPAQRYAISDLNLDVKAQGEQLPGGSLEARLKAGMDVDLAKGSLAVSDMQLDAMGLNVNGQLQGSAIQDAPAFSGRLNVAEFNLKDLLKRMGMQAPVTADAAVLQKLSLSTDLQASTTQAALENLNIRLDDSTLDGKARILLNKVPGYRFALKLDAIDLDRYLPPPAEAPAEGKTKQAAPAKGQEQPLFPVEALRQLDVDGSFSVGSLIVSKLKLQDARIKLTAKNGDVKLKQKVGKFYQGSLGGDIGINVKGKTPKLRVAQHAKGVQAQPLVKDLAGEDRLAGTGHINLDVTGTGQSVAAIKRTLGGKLDFAFTEGAVKGVNLGRMLREAAAKLKGKTLPPDNEANQTDFSELKGSGVITKGVLRNEDLSAKSPLFRLTGKGSINLAEDTLDYKVKPVLVASVHGQGGKDLEQLKGVPIPVHLTGPLAKPDWSIDLAEALTAVQKEKLKGKLSEELKKNIPQDLQEKLPGGMDKQLDGVLKGLFN